MRCAATRTRPPGRYLPAIADKLATARVVRPRRRRVTQDAELNAVVLELLGKRWSPEQVAHELRARFLDQRSQQLCTETLSQAIYDESAEVTRPAKRRRVGAAGASRDWSVEASERG